MLGQRYRGRATGCRGGMSKPQGSEWIYSPASILFARIGPVVLSPSVINNTERWTGSEEKAAGTERKRRDSPHHLKSVSYLSTDKACSPEGHQAQDEQQSCFCPTFTDAKLESKLNLWYEKAAITPMWRRLRCRESFKAFSFIKYKIPRAENVFLE